MSVLRIGLAFTWKYSKFIFIGLCLPSLEHVFVLKQVVLKQVVDCIIIIEYCSLHVLQIMTLMLSCNPFQTPMPAVKWQKETELYILYSRISIDLTYELCGQHNGFIRLPAVSWATPILFYGLSVPPSMTFLQTKLSKTQLS